MTRAGGTLRPVLLVADLLTPEERDKALAVVPWHPRARRLSGRAFGSLRDGTADAIDAVSGTKHVRPALVALQEGADCILQGALDLAESVACEIYFGRTDLYDPLGHGSLLSKPEDDARVRKRLVRVRLEDAATRIATAGNHLVNAHLRLAWECNAAGKQELASCGFDVDREQEKYWSDVAQMRRGLHRLSQQEFSVLPSFVLAEPFASYSADTAVDDTTWLRHQILHRDRPNYRDAQALGRTSVWAGKERFRVTVPRLQEEPGSAPSLKETRETASRAGDVTLAYAEEIWCVVAKLLSTLGIRISDSPGQVHVQMDIDETARIPRFPREKRDPGPFLLPAPVDPGAPGSHRESPLPGSS